MQTMPRAGSWMNSVKVVMGFLELAAVVKFLRAGELLWRGKADILSYDVSMALYVAICVACGLYLLNLYRLPHDHEVPESIGVPRLMFALSFLALGLYLLPAIFKTESGESQRPSGTVFAWVDSFLLPDPETPTKTPRGGNASPALAWEHGLQPALSRASREKKLVFLDFTGTSCTNCKLNERNVFPKAEVQQAFAKHVLLKLYTDTVPAGIEQQPDAAASLKFRNERFDSGALPLYALLRPTGGESFDIVALYGQDGNGLIEDVPAFVKWLDR
jgi:thiol:disulfide interchange protein DsbD